MRNRLTYANVTATLALVIAVAGGTAYAADTIFSSDIVDGEVKSVDIGKNQVLGSDVRGEALTGEDVADQSGVDTCVSTTRLGQLCVRAENSHRTWAQAVDHCANLGLRAPSLGEALELATTHDIPNVDALEGFWTSDRDFDGVGELAALVADNGEYGLVDTSSVYETVCVTNPTN